MYRQAVEGLCLINIPQVMIGVSHSIRYVGILQQSSNVCVCCVRVCARARVCACACVRARACVCVCGGGYLHLF